MRSYLRPAALLSVAVTVALAGCGGSSYPATADNICKQYNGKIRAIPQPRLATQLSGYIEQLTPIFRQAVGKLQSVKPPGDKKAAYDQYVSALSQEATTLDRAAAAAKTNPRQAVTLIVAAQTQLKAQIQQNARAAGLKSCANGT